MSSAPAPAPKARSGRIAAVAALLAGSVLLSRALGYVREMVLAYQLGTSAEADAYRAAFQLPDILNYFLAGGALSIAFVPFYTRTREREGQAAADRTMAAVLGTMTLLAVAATALMWWWAEPLVAWQFGFVGETRALCVRLTRIVLPAQIFFVAGGIVRAALMAHDRFATQALAPVLYNAAIIAGGGVFGTRFGAEGFAWGALAGAAIGPLLAPLLDARRAGIRVGWRAAPADPAFLGYLALAAPLMLGLSLLTLDEWYERWFGSRVGEGVVAQLAYARQLMLAPVAVVGQAVATAALPALAQLWSARRAAALDAILLRTLGAALAVALLLAALFAALAEPIVALLFERGAFTAADTRAVGGLLRILSLAVPAWVVQQIAVRGFYARSDTWRPMWIGTATALLALPLYFWLGGRAGASGLAAAGALAMNGYAGITLLLLRRWHGGPPLRPLLATTLRVLPPAAVGGALAALVAAALDPAWQACLAGGAAFVLVAIPGAWALGDEATREALARLVRARRPHD